MEKVFTIYDTVAQRSGPLFSADTIGEAERQFTATIERAQDGSLFKTHPQDYQLWYLGEYDIRTPSLQSHKAVLVTDGSKILKSTTKGSEA